MMKTFTVKYISTEDDDVCSVWVYADTASEAVDKVKMEYWDVGMIAVVREV